MYRERERERETCLPLINLMVHFIVCSFVGAVMSSLIRGLSCDLAIKVGLRAAYTSLHSPHAISKELNPNFVSEESISDWAPWKASPVL